MRATVVVAGGAFALAALLAGCSGDARPFEEAVEVRELGLVSLSVEPPEDSVLPLSVNPGDRVDFVLAGSDAAGLAVEVSGEDRDWRVADPAVASIDEDGRLLARADGTTTVSVRIGDVAAPPFDLAVSTAALTSIDAIDRVDDGGALAPCLAAEYAVTGLFSDGSRRRLRELEWTTPTAGVRITPLESGRARLAATRSGTAALVASVNEARLETDLEVADSLREIDIGPATLATSVGNEQQLVATGRYTDADGTEREANITDAVEWSVPSGTDFIEIGTEGEDAGLVSARAAGAATVRAACGEVAAVEDYLVSAASGGDGGLSFEGEENDRIEVRLGDTVQLRVSTGDEYDSDDDVTEEARWRLISNPALARLDTDGEDRGRFVAVAIGTVQVEASYLGLSETLTIDIVDPSSF